METLPTSRKAKAWATLGKQVPNRLQHAAARTKPEHATRLPVWVFFKLRGLSARSVSALNKNTPQNQAAEHQRRAYD